MVNYRFSSEADKDLLEIARYTIVDFGVKQARIFKEGLDDCFNSLADNHNLGRDASELIPRLKRFPYRSHTIFYRPMKKGIFIIRILSQSMDFDRHL